MKEEQARTSTLNSYDATSTNAETWSVAHTLNLSITLGMDVLFLSIKLPRQPAKLLTRRVLKRRTFYSHEG